MEQTKYLMWSSTRRSSSDQRSLISQPVHPTFSSSLCTESWEERAFAVDSEGNFLGGCTWPPTSYTCSFCRREFRSAQALGGHMNVHRRDRAMLKQQSSNSRLAEENYNNDLSHNPSLLMNLRANPNCSLDMMPSIFYKAPEVSAGKVTPPHRPISSPNSFFSTSALKNQFEADSTRTLTFVDTTEGKQSDISILQQLKHGSESLKMGDLSYDDPFSGNYICHGGENIVSNKKRRRTADIGVLPLFERTSSNIQAEDESEVHKFSPNPVEELDLELRLGGYSKLQQISCKDHIVVVE